MNELVEINGDELIQAIRYDCVTFFAFYMAEDLTQEVPELHIDIWNELLHMLDTANLRGVEYALKKLFAVPRDHAKTTVAKLAVILFIRYSKLRAVLYVSKTNGHAKNAIRDILAWLASPQESMVYGPMITVKSSETESLWIVKIALRNSMNEQPVYKTVTFKALGSDQHVRGLNVMNTRPQIVVVDDIEDLDNTKESQQDGLDEWFLGSFLKSFDSSRSICIFIGNMIRKTSLLARLAKEEDWNPTVFGALVRNRDTGNLESLWPQRHPVQKLLAEYAFFRRMGKGYMWEAEMMNLTQDEIMIKDFEHAIRPPIPDQSMVEAGFLALDPAFGVNSGNDDSAITVHLRIRGLGIPILAESWHGKVNENELFDKMVELSFKWGITTWCIEADAAQKLLISYFTLLIRDRRMNESLFTMVPIRSGGKDKASRILAFRTSVGSGSYAVSDSEFDLIDKLGRYDPNSKDHDDLCDSGAYGPIAWALHGETITVNGVKQVLMLAFLREGTSQATFLEHQVSSF